MLLKLNLLKFLKRIFNHNIFDSKEELICFVCGNESLPEPLNEDDENYWLSQLKNGNQNAIEILIEHNLRLVVYISKKFENTNIDIEDLISVGSIGLIKAVKSFDADKNIKLATYASRCIENEILMHLRKTKKIKTEMSLDEPLNSDLEGNELLLADILSTDYDIVFKSVEKEVEKDLLWQVILKLPKREKEIMLMRFGLFGSEEKTQKEVADMMQISQSYISRIEKKILSKLKKEISKLS